MGNLNGKGSDKPLEQIYLSPRSKETIPQEPNMPDLATAVSRMLGDPRSPTVEYARTPIYRADMDAVVTSQPEDGHQGNSFMLEPAYAMKTISFDEKDNEELESEHTVSNDVLVQNESGYEMTKKRNTLSSEMASQGTTSDESLRTTRHVSSSRKKHSLATKPLKVLHQSISGADDVTETQSLSQHSAHSSGLFASFRSPGNVSSKYQRINNE